ncbi:DgyrCDS2086 [Dimorphilus gyrociliatus]|uniref:DgyrCDS2086 n=1 Tax=Dimorphilus gyrociliatus TaxID=2664684 RepID=A0A7I8V967_9ANNE|nr:DgyrCDS2086 [Dimorphilus gyrociliatus]
MLHSLTCFVILSTITYVVSLDYSIYEEIPNGTIVANLTADVRVPASIARDRDAGRNGQVTYWLASYNEFRIKEKTGEIFSRFPLDYETKSRYLFTVKACDRGTPKKCSTPVRVIVNVRDANDNPPEITIDTLTSSKVAYVNEDQETKAFVARVLLEDKDDGRNGELECSEDAISIKQSREEEELFIFHIQEISSSSGKYITNSPTVSEPFEIKPFVNSYQLVTTRKLDREDRDTYSIKINCADKGHPRRTAWKSLTVKVKDVNDNNPILQNSSLQMNVNETAIVGSVIGRIRANDGDIGPNGELSYLIDSDVDFFQLDPSREQIEKIFPYFKKKLDFEIQQNFSFRVTVRDHGKPSRQSTGHVIIRINNCNDERPIFEKKAYEFNVTENWRGLLGKLTAVDLDLSPFNQTVYELDGPEAFSLERQTGKLRLLRDLDRELQSSYKFYAVARDVMDASLSDKAEILVTVLDKNDEKPYFYDEAGLTFSVSRNAGYGTLIGKIRAADKDLGTNLTFEITQRRYRRLFLITADGELFLNGQIDDHSEEEFNFEVRISDGKLSESKSFKIIVDASSSSFFHKFGKTTLVTSLGIGSSILFAILIIICCVLIRKRRRKKKNHQRRGDDGGVVPVNGSVRYAFEDDVSCISDNEERVANVSIIL